MGWGAHQQSRALSQLHLRCSVSTNDGNISLKMQILFEVVYVSDIRMVCIVVTVITPQSVGGDRRRSCGAATNLQ